MLLRSRRLNQNIVEKIFLTNFIEPTLFVIEVELCPQLKGKVRQILYDDVSGGIVLVLRYGDRLRGYTELEFHLEVE
jgi:hypothetical protein